MGIRRGSGSGEATLRPARWPGRPAGLTVLRIGMVAGLLALAAVLLHGRADADCPPAARRSPPASAPTTAEDPADRPGTAEGAEPAGTSAGPRRPLPLPAGSVGVPIRLAEPAALAVLRPGARVDLLAAPGAAGSGSPTATPTLVAARALVLDVVGADATDGTAALYLALQPQQAERAVGLPEGSRFAVVVRG